MTSAIALAVGGLGLFLFGMSLMTGALRQLANDKLRSLLSRFVNSPTKGAITGACATALLQSSSATTVAAVGFVGAGLLEFSQALGVIFGANFGTTITGWLVALVGFKLSLGTALLPLILIGAFLRLTGGTRLEHIGTTLAGFGLIFVGIGLLQDGLVGLQGHITPEHFPNDTFGGRLLLVLLGLVITIVTQSSSAGVATALAAVHTNTISLNQAAAMVIGMDVGTTATAALATIGGNVQARRTGFAHVIYNTLTGIGAFLLLTPYMKSIEYLLPTARETDPELVLVGFHTFFNFLGVVGVLPLAGRFANLLIRIFPERGNPLTKQLDRSLLKNPAVAINAASQTLWEIAQAVVVELQKRLAKADSEPNLRQLDDAQAAINECNNYLQDLASRFEKPPQIAQYVASMHILDHLRRIEARVREHGRLSRSQEDAELRHMAKQLIAAAGVLTQAEFPLSPQPAQEIRATNRHLKLAMRDYRVQVMQQVSDSQLTTSVAIARMDTARSLRRIGYHIWRIAYHFAEPKPEARLQKEESAQSPEDG